MLIIITIIISIVIIKLTLSAIPTINHIIHDPDHHHHPHHDPHQQLHPGPSPGSTSPSLTLPRRDASGRKEFAVDLHDAIPRDDVIGLVEVVHLPGGGPAGEAARDPATKGQLPRYSWLKLLEAGGLDSELG